ncbi:MULTISPECIES: hypothetical protein [Micrococcales]|uniref:Uncharacterized protein n=2 Tax=Micrococcales TaxID=85006 RepID=A0A2H1KHF3_BRELN|nr:MULTISPECIES: hypothetical protein [Micrococcales]AXK45932.1 hypothetical protein DWV08_10165 [Brachybacterium saurashtrense]RRR23670.1 hypothetical protein DXU92_01915 [Brachybacterium saurashtrense]SMX99181.1 hypothetical protein BLIN101_03359 [Brevibacterium linens]
MNTTTVLERLYSLRALEEAGYSGRATLTKLIKTGAIPAVLTPAGYKIRESDLHLIAVPVVPEGGDAA